MDLSTGSQSMINTKGRVVSVAHWEVDSRRTQGWRVIHNPKMEYYPEFDLSVGGHIPSQNIIENLNEVDVLPGADV